MANDTKDPKEDAIVQAGVDYVFEHSDGKDCPFCGARLGVGEEIEPKALKGHLKSKHPHQCIMAMQQDTLSPDLRGPDDPTPHDIAGLTMQDEFDRFDALYIPDRLREDCRKAGDKLIWKSPEKIKRLIDQGGQVVKMTKEELADMPMQGSSETGDVKANELILVRVPERLATARQAQKRARVTQGLAASKEALAQNREGVERLIYDSLKSKNYSSTQAGQVARAVAGKVEREDDHNFQGGDPRARDGISVTRG